MPSFESLKLDAIKKAVEKTQSSLNPDIGKLALLTEDLYAGAIDIVKECFIDDEPICKAVGMKFTDEYRDVWYGAFRESLSLVLINETNGEIMGLRVICKLQRGINEGTMDSSKIKDQPIKDLVRIAGDAVKMGKFFERHDANEAFYFWGLGVARKYRQRGVATLLMRAALKFIHFLGFEPYVLGAASSSYSKKIYEKLGFEKLAEIDFDSYSLDGEFLLRGKTGTHKSITQYGYLKDAKI